jgi:hypothetical protein
VAGKVPEASQQYPSKHGNGRGQHAAIPPCYDKYEAQWPNRANNLHTTLCLCATSHHQPLQKYAVPSTLV